MSKNLPADTLEAVNKKLYNYINIRTHIHSIRVLQRDPVDPGANAQVVGVGDNAGRNKHGTQRRERVETLTETPLTSRKRCALPLASGDIVADGVSCGYRRDPNRG